MSYFVRAAVLVGAALLANVVPPAAAQMVTPPQAADTAADPVIAIVDGAPIKRSDVLAMQRSLPPEAQQMPVEVLFPLILDRLIDVKLISQAGRRDNLDRDPEVRDRLVAFEERLIQDVYLKRKMAGAMTEDGIKARYAKYVAENPAESEVSARHILVATEQKARDILAQIRGGADFAKLAGEHTLDPSGKQSGGDLGFFKKGEMVPEFSEMAFKLKEGEVAPSPVKTQFGWHVIRVDKIRTQAQSFDDLREQLTNDMAQEIVRAELGRLRQTAKVERFNLDGSPLR
ncbi:MAG: peptidylprolyl isomerase [Alphaproteobacteria bacterium]|nr:peptidylprolyl isomerase [Alphaproteobacteria bacterium]